MYNSLGPQEIIFLVLFSIMLLSVLLALFNIDFINNAVLQFHKFIVKKHSETKSGLVRFFLAFYKYPGEIPNSISHDGWRSGLTILSSALSTVIFGGLITAAAIALYYLLIIIGTILLVIAGIILVIYILGAIFGGS